MVHSSKAQALESQRFVCNLFSHLRNETKHCLPKSVLWEIKGARVYKVPSLALLMTHYGHP